MQSIGNLSYRNTSRDALINPSSLLRRDPLAHYEERGATRAYWGSKTLRLRNAVGNYRGNFGEVKHVPDSDIANLKDVEEAAPRPIPASFQAPWNRLE